MKIWPFLIVFIYFAIFALAGFLFYRFYLPQIINPANPQDKIISQSHQNKIYFASSNNLYRFSPDLASERLKEGPTTKIRSDAKIGQTHFDANHQTLYYENQTNEDDWEIWQLHLEGNLSQKLFSLKTPGLENFTQFKNPRPSGNGRKLAFLAMQNDEHATLFVATTNAWQNLKNISLEVDLSQIVNFAWAPQEEKILAAFTKDDQTFLKIIDLASKDAISVKSFWDGKGQIKQLSWLEEGIFLALSETKEGQGITNLYLLDKTNPDLQNITNLTNPKNLENFAVSPNGKYLVMQIKDATTETNQIYYCQINGTNMTQLTEEGNHITPVFAPESDRIAFLIPQKGIFTITLESKKTKKILNLDDAGQIILWR